MGVAALGARVTGRLGIFGGTFDPIHIAHLAVAEEAAEALGLERVLFVPAGIPPHKPDRAITAGEHRLAMVELAIAGNERFAVDRRELDRPGPSYTVDTLEALRRETASDLVLILSAEAFLGLHDVARAASASSSWHGSRSRRVTDTRRPARTSWRPSCRTSRIARPSSTGRVSACPRASSGRAPRPVDRCAISCRMRSRPTSATMRCTPTTGGPAYRDRTRQPHLCRRDRRAPRAHRAPTACRIAPRPRPSPSGRRSSSPAGSSSWPRTRRPPTSSCSTSLG